MQPPLVSTKFKIVPGLCAAVLALLLIAPFAGQTPPKRPSRPGIVSDWTQHHVIYSNGASLAALAASQRDPRAYFNYLAVVRRMQGRQMAERMAQNRRGGEAVDGQRERAGQSQRIDWAVSLGPAGVTANQYPSKFTFDVNATPDCTNDFVVANINAAPSATQANIAAFNNLYSGSAGGTGICGSGAATPYWAYRVGTAAASTSTAPSLDGKKVAFVENSNPPVFHVLTWTAGQGSVGAPATPAGGQIVNLTLAGSTAVTRSSPFVDYFNDVAYIATDSGRIYKITGVFNGTPTLAGAPWPLAAGTTQLAGPVIDFNTGNLFVSSFDGHVYGFTLAGVALVNSPLAVGLGGSPSRSVQNPVLVDVMSGTLYAYTGDNGANAVIVQANSTNFLPTRTVPIGNRNIATIHTPAFNDAYFTQPTNQIGTTGEWFLYACGVAANAGRTPVLYRIGFNASRVMNTVPDASQISLSAINAEQCSPITEFRNGLDRIFFSLRSSNLVEAWDVSSALTPTQSATPVTEPSGTSGIIVDNVSTANQASSIYFTTLANSAACGNHRCLVKLTQGGLQ